MPTKQKQLKFNVRWRYDRLNDAAKQILKDKATTRFKYSEQQFYKRLVSDKLSADELVFFSSAFECQPQELYSRKPPKMQSIQALEQKKAVQEYKGLKNIAKDLGLGKPD